ncbi:MAG: hypothetical protein AAGF11_44395 [Myxococcota bacterium]
MALRLTKIEARTPFREECAPGHAYWQHDVDDKTHRLRGSERIRSGNHSPDTLKYLWPTLYANTYEPHVGPREHGDHFTRSIPGIRLLQD